MNHAKTDLGILLKRALRLVRFATHGPLPEVMETPECPFARRRPFAVWNSSRERRIKLTVALHFHIRRVL